MLFGVYAGAMRGMNTDATRRDRRRSAAVAAAAVAHLVGDRDARQVLRTDRTRSCATARSSLVNDATFETAARRPTATGWCGSPATDRADELGHAARRVDGDGRRVRRAQRARRHRRAGRGDARVDPVVPDRSTSPPTRPTLRAGYELGADAGGMGVVKSKGTVTIDVEVCKGCELCIPACPPRVLTMSTRGEPPRVPLPRARSTGCTGCAACQLICPDFVFEVFRERARTRG